MDKLDTIVVGGGILGTMTARHFAKLGRQVTVIKHPGGPLASDGSLVWLNASTVADPVYASVRAQSLALWHDIKATDPDCPVAFPGSLLAAPDDTPPGVGDALSKKVAADLAPGFDFADLACRFAPGEGRADPAALAAWGRDQLAQCGVDVISAQVASVSSGKVALANGASLKAHRILLTAGHGTADLLRQLGVHLPVDRKPGVVFWTNPVPRLADPVMMTPHLDLWQREDGVVLVASTLSKSTADDARVEGGRVVELLRTMFPGQDFSIAKVVQRDRPVPRDGLPLVGPVPGHSGLWVAVTHSGMTLAPIVADALFRMVTDGTNPIPQYALDRD